jgi:hypothetical protein
MQEDADFRLIPEILQAEVYRIRRHWGGKLAQISGGGFRKGR